MKFKTGNIQFDGRHLIIDVPTIALEDAEAIANSEGVKEIEVNLYKPKRGLTANSLMWLALRYLATKFDTTKEELYLKYLREDGIFQYYIVKPAALDMTKKAFRIVDIEGKVVSEDGTEGIRIKAYPGTSVYDTKEFSYFLARIVEDAEAEGFNADYDLKEIVKRRFA